MNKFIVVSYIRDWLKEEHNLSISAEAIEALSEMIEKTVVQAVPFVKVDNKKVIKRKHLKNEILKEK